MKLTSIPQLYRNLKRWTEILTVLSKYGLADWLSHSNVTFVRDQLKDRQGQSLARLTQERRIRMALSELGPTFIKIGQLLSTRPDIVGIALAEELRQLQCDAPADPPDVVRRTLQQELGLPIDDLFASFSDIPIASASIGQAHLARLPDGRQVVVKVQHAGIERMVQEDLEILAGLAALAERLPEFAPYRPAATVAELSRTLRRELDFGREERNIQQFVFQFRDDPTIRFPVPRSEFCTSRVLTMEYLEGIPLNEPSRLRASGLDLEVLARRGGDLFLWMIFSLGFYHADPHPGNILVMPGNVIGLLDFGMVGRIEERLREEIEEMLASIVRHDVVVLAGLIRRVCDAPPDLDGNAFANDLADFVGNYANQSLDHFHLDRVLTDMIEILHTHHITLPPQVGLLIKALVTLDGTTRALSPAISLMEMMRPFHRRMVLRRLSPRHRLKKLRRTLLSLERLAEVLPGRIVEILEQVQSGKFDVHLDHRGLEPSVNRLVLGMLASALFLGSTLLLSQEVPPLLFRDAGGWYGIERVSLPGIAGCAIALLLGLRLLRAIGKSGHLDRRS
ncbi:MAG: AarF/ABC1/UbiB kinase family protein [Planctomycetes bacterium]|nr:AarF/ABC1/UbiB kinase family protein [Planctomycetota bacterium]